MENVVFLIAISLLAGAVAVLFAKNREMNTDLNIALDTIARHTKVFADYQKALDAVMSKTVQNEAKILGFKERFNQVMAEAERQNELEAQWNKGLNNILNYSLAQAFEPRGEKQ